MPKNYQQNIIKITKKDYKKKKNSRKISKPLQSRKRKKATIHMTVNGI